MVRDLRKTATDKCNRWEYKFCDNSNDYQGSATIGDNEGYHEMQEVIEEITLLEPNLSSLQPSSACE
ncbi:hypothetical protein LOAG_10047, partial [Loa loa]